MFTVNEMVRTTLSASVTVTATAMLKAAEPLVVKVMVRAVPVPEWVTLPTGSAALLEVAVATVMVPVPPVKVMGTLVTVDTYKFCVAIAKLGAALDVTVKVEKKVAPVLSVMVMVTVAVPVPEKTGK